MPTLTVLLLLTALALLLSITGVTLAKYVMTSEDSATVTAKPLFLSSDKLGDPNEGIEYQIEASSEENVSISVALRNYIDDARITDADFAVSVEARTIDNKTIFGTESLVGFLAGGTKQEKIATVNVPASYFAEGAKVKIVAHSYLLYEREIEATFSYSEIESQLTYTVDDLGALVMLHIGGAKVGDSIEINWDNDLELDILDLIFDGVLDTSAILTLDSDEMKTLTFLKKNLLKDYSEADFPVIKLSS